MPGSCALKQRPLAQLRSRSTDSPAVTATGTTFWAACTKGRSKSAASRQQARISAPVHCSSLGSRWLASSLNCLGLAGTGHPAQGFFALGSSL